DQVTVPSGVRFVITLDADTQLPRGAAARLVRTLAHPRNRPRLEPATGALGVRFVITLDADTQLPRGAAARLVGTLAHPLNRPRLEPREGRVVEGYGILQPRIAPTLPTERAGSRLRA